MMRFLNALKFDLLTNMRNNIFTLYAVISILYILALRYMPLEYKEDLSILILFSDPSLLGFFFVGGIILLEKHHRTLDNLFTSPLHIGEYILAKIISLSIVSVISSFIIAIFGYGLNFNFIYLFFGVLMSSMMFTLIGIGAAVWVKSINQYLYCSPIYLSVFFLPLLDFFGVSDSAVFYLIPGKAAIILIEAAFKGGTMGEIIYAFMMLTAAIVTFFYCAKKLFYKNIILRIGGE